MAEIAHTKLLLLLKRDLDDVGTLNTPLNKRKTQNSLKQKETNLIEYSVIEKVLYRDRDNEHVVPIPVTTLNEYNQKTGSDIKRVELHYGPNSDELARSYHANALTIGAAVYFRNGAYKPETEEGRKTLAHELTHVQQNSEDILAGQKSVEDLEKEAEKKEEIAETIPKGYRYLEYNGRKIKVSEKMYKKIMETVKMEFENAVASNVMNLDEQEYLKFLLSYEQLEARGEMIWQK